VFHISFHFTLGEMMTTLMMMMILWLQQQQEMLNLKKSLNAMFN